jgi:pimeloyl-ACP methyl ester carboxylesterase
MKINIAQKSFQILGHDNFPITIDIHYQEGSEHEGRKAQNLIVFLHGFKGFKDWGGWNVLASKFAESGFAFLKFNFSHNGTTVAQPTDFADLDAFGRNTYGIELAESRLILDWLAGEEFSAFAAQNNINATRPALIGHSRGGGIALLTAARLLTAADLLTTATHFQISALALWASVDDLGWSWTEKTAADIENWQRDGFIYTSNMRTRQKMPLNFSLYADYIDNRAVYSLETAIKNLACPVCILHGTDDVAVNHSHAERLYAWAQEKQNTVQLSLIADANHVFGASHPFVGEALPLHSEQLFATTLAFFRAELGE